MDAQTQSTFNFTEYEIWYLISLMPQATVIGFRNPTTGMLVEDMFPIIQEASFSLLDKDFIYADSNNELKIRDDLGSLIRTLVAPQHTWLIAFRRDSNQRELVRSFNFDMNRAVLLEELDEGSYFLQEIESKDRLLFLSAEPFSDKVFWAPDTEPLYCSQSKAEEFQRLADVKEMEEVKKVLENVQGDELSKTHLVETLQTPKVKYSYIRFMDRDNSQRGSVDGFAVLAGEHYVWILEIVDEAKKLVRISKTELKDLNKKFIPPIPFF